MGHDVILPQTFRFTKEEYMKKFEAKEVPIDFEYNSGSNESWLSAAQIRDLVKQHVDSNFSATE